MSTIDQKRKHSKNHLSYKGNEGPTTGCPICLDMYYKAQASKGNTISPIDPTGPTGMTGCSGFTRSTAPVNPGPFTYQGMAPASILLTPQPKVPEKTNTYVKIVLDSSGSMGSITEATKRTLKNVLNDIKVNAKKNNIDVFVGLRQFASCVAGYDFDDVKSDHLPTEIHFYPNGNTALLDATGQTIQDMQWLDNLTGNKHSFLLIVITDGDENYSSRFRSTILADLMQAVQRTDRYTLTFQLPPGRKRNFCTAYGIPEGNVVEWEASERGMDQVYATSAVGFSNYACSRAVGVKATKGFYNTDLSNVKSSDLNKLTPINHQVKVLKVNAEAVIQPFVEAELKFYRPGSAYYQLTKDEKIQPYKVVLIRDKSTRKIYAGNDARKLMGLPDASPAGDLIKVRPGNHANFDVFVQSSSNNRKLVRGTDLIIWQ